MATPSELIAADVEATEVPLRRLSSSDVRRMAEAGVFEYVHNVELIGGLLIAAEPSSVYHSGPLQTLNGLFVRGLDPSLWVVRIQQPFSVDEYSEPEPDVAVVPFAEAKRLDSHPQKAALIIEVSHSSLRFDTRTKLRLYAAAGIPEYWVVDTEKRRVLVHTEPKLETGSYGAVRTAVAADTVLAGFAGAPAIRVADLFP